MEENIISFIDEAIKLELNMARLYNVFAEHVDEDASFWNQLESEERNHAILLKTGKDFVKFDRFPETILPDQLALLKESNKFVDQCMEDFMDNKDRRLAFDLAIKLENLAGEAHFQKFMDSVARDSLTTIFQKLNQADKDHAARILEYSKTIVQED